MAKKRKSIPVAVLRDLLNYDAETGLFTWKERTADHFGGNKRAMKIFNTQFSGKEALIAELNGYRQGCINKVLVYAHRVAWAMHYGRWPRGEIDHINGDRADNRIANLRDVSHKANQRNTKLPSHNTSGHIGVSMHIKSGKWSAQIGGTHLGLFERKNDAMAAYRRAARSSGYHENHGQRRG